MLSGKRKSKDITFGVFYLKLKISIYIDNGIFPVKRHPETTKLRDKKCTMNGFPKESQKNKSELTKGKILSFVFI
jgi:hypothetical protein